MTIEVTAHVGRAVADVLPAVAALRIAVFREWPYLYDGSEAYEREYLAGYAGGDAVVVVARDGDRVVGAATAMSLAAHTDDVVPPLVAAGFDPARVCYFGESVLEAAYRGRGLGHRFFDEREAFAGERGYALAAFCAVERPADHPARPADHRDLSRFWSKRGFVRRPDIVAEFRWKDVGDAAETAKPMVFWIKEPP